MAERAESRHATVPVRRIAVSVKDGNDVDDTGLGCAAVAQDPPAPIVEAPAAVAEAPPAGPTEPGEHHEHLDRLAGDWDLLVDQGQELARALGGLAGGLDQQVDVLVTPTSPTTAFPLGAKTDDPLTMYLSDIYTIAVNLAGLPGMSVPAGFINNRPAGLQIIGNYFDESRLLNVAHKYQQQTDWHRQIPEAFI